MKKATILLKSEEQEKVKNKVNRILEKYDNFVLVDVTPEQINSLQKEGFKVVVKPDLEKIQLGSVNIDTSQLRYDRGGAIMVHSAYPDTQDPGTEQHHYIVQFIGSIKKEWKDEIKRLGGIISGPLPSYSYIVEMDGQTRSKVLKLPFIHWVGHYDKSYRLSSKLVEEIEDAQKSESRGPGKEVAGGFPEPAKEKAIVPNAYTISFHDNQNLDQALPRIRSLGANISSISRDARTVTVSFSRDTTQILDKLRQLASIHGVRSIEARRIMQLCNDIAIRIITGLQGSGNLDLPLTGEGEIIAIADTGLDTGDASTVHEDIRDQIVGIKSWPIQPVFNDQVDNPGGNDGPADVVSGHGTHVAGSCVGNGQKSEGTVKGLANRAGLFFQAIEQKMEWKSIIDKEYNGEYILGGQPDDISELFKEAYNAGARIHSDSWTGKARDSGLYDELSHSVDRFVWENKDMVILFAAGNYGRDEERNGTVSFGSITPPATAKNCVSVGASENLRENFTETYRDKWYWDFPLAPIGYDRLADNPDDIAAFSGRGPCLDGRFKPDVVAPGTFILSTKSSLAKEDDENPEPDVSREKFYMYMHGTSMATPLTAGAVALIRQYLRQEGLQPSASLVKAALIHTAVRKTCRYSASAASSDLVDNAQGWGHVNLKPFISKMDGFKMEFIEGGGLFTGDMKDFSFNVNMSDFPFKVTLAYTDYPGPGAINNLNLLVTDPAGMDYYGNQFSAPFDSAFDEINNVETVYIIKPKTGKYKVSVLASDVSMAPQDFSLVVSGGL